MKTGRIIVGIKTLAIPERLIEKYPEIASAKSATAILMGYMNNQLEADGFMFTESFHNAGKEVEVDMDALIDKIEIGAGGLPENFGEEGKERLN